MQGEEDPTDQPRIITQEIDLRVAGYPDKGPLMGDASEHDLNIPKPFVGSGFAVTSDYARSEVDPF